MIRPRLGDVGPFWAVALVLGLLALPRADELEGFDRTPPPRRRPGPPGRGRAGDAEDRP